MQSAGSGVIDPARQHRSSPCPPPSTGRPTFGLTGADPRRTMPRSSAIRQKFNRGVIQHGRSRPSSGSLRWAPRPSCIIFAEQVYKGGMAEFFSAQPRRSHVPGVWSALPGTTRRGHRGRSGTRGARGSWHDVLTRSRHAQARLDDPRLLGLVSGSLAHASLVMEVQSSGDDRHHRRLYALSLSARSDSRPSRLWNNEEVGEARLSAESRRPRFVPRFKHTNDCAGLTGDRTARITPSQISIVREPSAPGSVPTTKA